MTPHFRFMDKDLDWPWIMKQIGILKVEDTVGIMAIDLDTGENVGACVMDNWTSNSVQCHFTVSKPMILRYGFLECCFGLMFNEVGVLKVYGQVPSDNEKALRFNKHIGFTEKFRLEEAHAPGVDYVICELTRENCMNLPHIERAA